MTVSEVAVQRSMGTPYRKSVGISGAFDAVVIGSGMGGLSAASLLAQSGRRVLVLEQHNVIGGLTQSYMRKGYRWTVGLHYIGEVGTPATMTWKLFNKVTGGKIEWAPMPDIYNHMVIAGRRYDIPTGAAAYAAALKGYFPDEAEGIDRYIELVRIVSKSSAGFFAQKAMPEESAAAMYDGMCDKFHEYSDRVTMDVLGELIADPELIAVICANWGDYGLPPAKSSFAMHSMLVKHYLNGGHYPVGGGAAFARAIVPIIEEAGGKVLHSAEVAEVMVAGGRTTGVRLVSGEVVACPLVISNAGVKNTLGRLLPVETQEELGFDKALSKVTENYVAVGINIGFNRSAKELGFNGANIWAHPSNDFVANLKAHRDDFDAPFPWTFTTFASAKDPSWDKEFPGKATVEMYGYTNYEHFEKWSGSRWMKRGDDYLALKEKIKERLLEELFRHMPAARSALDYIEVSTPLTYETFDKRERGGFMGLETSPERFRQSWLRPTTAIGGLYLSGQDVSTGGVIGALAGGLLAASSVLGRDLMQEIKMEEVR
ncbi:MAG: phytoene desaturase family protein [Parvibaculaceae bacterium]